MGCVVEHTSDLVSHCFCLFLHWFSHCYRVLEARARAEEIELPVHCSPLVFARQEHEGADDDMFAQDVVRSSSLLHSPMSRRLMCSLSIISGIEDHHQRATERLFVSSIFLLLHIHLV